MLLRVVDFETTGLPGEGRICQIGWTDVLVRDGGGPPEIHPPFQMFVDPGHAIPPEVRAVHHIRDRDVTGAPSIDEGLRTMQAPNGNGAPTHYVAHNANFEREFCTIDAPWICTRKTAMRVWPEAPNHQNQTLRYWLKVDDDADFAPWDAMPPHRAGPDTYVTAFVLRRALEKAAPDQMVQWTSEPSLLPGAIHFGKHKGTPWSQVDPSYLDWIVTKASEMDTDVVFTARHWLRRHADDRR